MQLRLSIQGGRDWTNENIEISQCYDSAAALVVDGVVVRAAAEEPFNRKKHCGDFPAQAIAFCLQQAGIAKRCR
jgi:predicted NodU family carbamoyl transferase